MDVLRVAQSKRPGDVELHVSLDGLCVGALAGPEAVGGFVLTECSLLLLHAYNVCVYAFLAFTATLHFICILPMHFHAPPCRLLGCATRACGRIA